MEYQRLEQKSIKRNRLNYVMNGVTSKGMLGDNAILGPYIPELACVLTCMGLTPEELIIVK